MSTFSSTIIRMCCRLQHRPEDTWKYAISHARSLSLFINKNQFITFVFMNQTIMWIWAKFVENNNCAFCWIEIRNHTYISLNSICVKRRSAWFLSVLFAFDVIQVLYCTFVEHPWISTTGDRLTERTSWAGLWIWSYLLEIDLQRMYWW